MQSDNSGMGLERVEGNELGNFGNRFLPDRVRTKLEKAEEQAAISAIKYAQLRYIAEQAQKRISEVGINNILQIASDVDMMNRLAQSAETATPRQQAKMEAEIDRHLDYLSECADTSKKEILRQLQKHSSSKPGLLDRLIGS